jgi:hypothetical protein
MVKGSAHPLVRKIKNPCLSKITQLQSYGKAAWRCWEIVTAKGSRALRALGAEDSAPRLGEWHLDTTEQRSNSLKLADDHQPPVQMEESEHLGRRCEVLAQ